MGLKQGSQQISLLLIQQPATALAAGRLRCPLRRGGGVASTVTGDGARNVRPVGSHGAQVLAARAVEAPAVQLDVHGRAPGLPEQEVHKPHLAGQLRAGDGAVHRCGCRLSILLVPVQPHSPPVWCARPRRRQHALEHAAHRLADEGVQGLVAGLPAGAVPQDVLEDQQDGQLVEHGGQRQGRHAVQQLHGHVVDPALVVAPVGEQPHEVAHRLGVKQPGRPLRQVQLHLTQLGARGAAVGAGAVAGVVVVAHGDASLRQVRRHVLLLIRHRLPRVNALLPLRRLLRLVLGQALTLSGSSSTLLLRHGRLLRSQLLLALFPSAAPRARPAAGHMQVPVRLVRQGLEQAEHGVHRQRQGGHVGAAETAGVERPHHLVQRRQHPLIRRVVRQHTQRQGGGHPAVCRRGGTVAGGEGGQQHGQHLVQQRPGGSHGRRVRVRRLGVAEAEPLGADPVERPPFHCLTDGRPRAGCLLRPISSLCRCLVPARRARLACVGHPHKGGAEGGDAEEVECAEVDLVVGEAGRTPHRDVAQHHRHQGVVRPRQEGLRQGLELGLDVGAHHGGAAPAGGRHKGIRPGPCMQLHARVCHRHALGAHQPGLAAPEGARGDAHRAGTGAGQRPDGGVAHQGGAPASQGADICASEPAVPGSATSSMHSSLGGGPLAAKGGTQRGRRFVVLLGRCRPRGSAGSLGSRLGGRVPVCRREQGLRGRAPEELVEDFEEQSRLGSETSTKRQVLAGWQLPTEAAALVTRLVSERQPVGVLRHGEEEVQDVLLEEALQQHVPPPG